MKKFLCSLFCKEPPAKKHKGILVRDVLMDKDNLDDMIAKYETKFYTGEYDDLTQEDIREILGDFVLENNDDWGVSPGAHALRRYNCVAVGFLMGLKIAEIRVKQNANSTK